MHCRRIDAPKSRQASKCQAGSDEIGMSNRAKSCNGDQVLG
jgi:hypothetical protein